MPVEAKDFIAQMRAASLETLPIIDGTIANPMYLDHRGAKNWAARVTRDYGTAPGGLEREFFAHGPRNRVFLLEDIKPGDFVEFGGDKTSYVGSKKARRAYREVVTVSEEALVVRPVKFEEIEKKHQDEDAAAAPNPLAHFSNEMILAEARRRGLA